ncbi:MAG: glycogen phosphorylase [Spirochaetae bacterium HGW-Spirochaetae-1]|jgi:starch phosphorylase|nr:MAG: glycogen phosphorylase [Spirochaetae bacterium HGW-Spirochaetae-1]
MPPRKSAKDRLSTSTNPLKGNDLESLKLSFINHIEFSLGRDEYSATQRDLFYSMALVVRDRLIERWIETQQTYHDMDVKRVYYLSMEYLMGRTLGNSLINLGLTDIMRQSLDELGYSMDDLAATEWDAGLGNGGLGRLAACFMDSLATLELPAMGYGIRYDYGIFFQKIINGYQVETPDNWLRFGTPWEFPRPEYLYPVKFYGTVNQYQDDEGRLRSDWVNTDIILAMAYDIPVPGFRNNTVNNLRLWSAKSTREFDLGYFNHGDYEKAVSEKSHSETVSKVLYPNDNIFEGKELRLKQEYFFVSATLQDIIRRYKTDHHTFTAFPDRAAIQLNDTHPAVAIPELMRILIDIERITWEEAWDITLRTFGYTNHTILPEALEKWPLSLMQQVLPRHLQIIYEINRRFLEHVSLHFPGEPERLGRMSIIEEGPDKRVRMAHLAIVGSHSVNGVAALHSDIIKASLFRDFHQLWPERFNNKTNGITQRRWLMLCNPGLSQLITSRIGDGWCKNLDELKNLAPLTEDAAFRDEWMRIKRTNKDSLAAFIEEECDIDVDPASLFDCQVKRMHEYKRQLLNVLHVVTLYNRIRSGATGEMVPRTVIFSGKSAPGYHMAKLTIKLINSIAKTVNNDPTVRGLLKVVFIPNYSVSVAEKIMPGADLSEQISTAGTEASGTGNMKFALNGALTIGTLDGANIEIAEEVGADNIFIFGLKPGEVDAVRSSGYSPRTWYDENPELRQAVDMISGGFFSPSEPDLFKDITNSLLGGDYYLLFADYASYIGCQERVGSLFSDSVAWTRMSILNVAAMGKFSTDRTIDEYANDIWKTVPVPIELGRKKRKR